MEDRSVCKQEWSRALRYKKPIVPLLYHRGAIPPFRLESRQHIDFTGSFDQALAKLRNHLNHLVSPAGMLQALEDRLADAKRDLRRAEGPEQEARVRDDIAQLEAQIESQRRIVADPEAAKKRTEESIARGLERERQPSQPVGGISRTKFLNPPPALAPSYFQDRHVETQLIGDFLKDESKRLMTVVGRAGIGKTATVCRVLKALERGFLPEDLGPLEVDGIIYLSAIGSRRVNAPNLYEDLLKLLPADLARRVEPIVRDSKTTTETKMRALLEAFPAGRTVVLLDNFEDVIDPATHNLTDAELDEALRALVKLPHHGVKVILTTRVAPRALNLVQPGRQMRLDLDGGLESPYAENILREMDADGKLGLKSAPAERLALARERTRGFPRALEALFAILSADRDTTLEEILAGPLPENVTVDLVGEAFSRLDPTQQRVMQALAVYGRPVPPAAVDYLLQPHQPGVDSAPVLSRLVNMHFARKEAGRFYLHPVDREYALARLAPGEVSDRRANEPAFTLYGLRHRAAEYFKQARLPRENWKTIEDLAPQLAEFDLRCEGQDYETAADVLAEISFNYLMLWGWNRRVVELNERLLGKLEDSTAQIDHSGQPGPCVSQSGSGEASHRLPRASPGHRCARSATDATRGPPSAIWAICYNELGQIARAIDHYEQSLAIMREVGDRRDEGEHLGNLGICYSDLRTDSPRHRSFTSSPWPSCARSVTDAARGSVSATWPPATAPGPDDPRHRLPRAGLGHRREVGDRRGEGIDLGNLGDCYSDLGQTVRAIDYHRAGPGHRTRSRQPPRRGLSLSFALRGCPLMREDIWTRSGRRSKPCGSARRRVPRRSSAPATRTWPCAHLCVGDLPEARARRKPPAFTMSR